MKKKISLFLVVVLSHLSGVIEAQNVTIASANLKKQNERFELASSEYAKLIQYAGAAMARQEEGAAQQLSLAYYEKGDNYLLWAQSEMDNDFIRKEKLDSAAVMFEKGVKVMDVLPMNHIGLARVSAFNNDAANMNLKLSYAQELVANKKNKISKEMSQDALLAVASAYNQFGTKEDLSKTIVILNDVLKRNPNNKELYVVWGDYEDVSRKFASGIEASNLSSAIAKYNQAIVLDPLYTVAVLKKGKLYKQVENWDEALKFYNEAIKIDPEFAPAYREKAELLKSAGRYPQAVESYAKYLSLNNSCSVNQRYATFLFLTKEYASALTEIERTIPCNPNNLVMYRVLGYTCLETGDYAKGVENMDKFFNMAAGDPQIITGRDYAIKGKLLARLGQDSIGAGMIIQAMKLDTSYKAGYDDIIEIYKKKYDKAAYWYGQKIKNTSAKPLDYFNWGQNLYLSKNYVRADSVFQLVENNFLEATLMRAKANNRLEAPDNFQGLGKPYFEKYIQLVGGAQENIEKNKKGLLDAYDYLGVYFLKKEEDVCAKAAWSVVLKLDPNHKRANEMMAQKEIMALDLAATCNSLPVVPAPEEKK
jgi:tetratricopeptide (TPR) repeat protein